MATEPIRRPVAVNVPGVAIVGRFSGDHHWPRFVEDNRDLVNLPVSDKFEWIRSRWEELYRRHIGEPPPPERTLISPDVRTRLKKVVRDNDPMVVRDVLAPLEEGLIESVRVTLEVLFDFREPRRTVRDYSRRPTASFEAARRQIRSNNRHAVASFREIWSNQPENYNAKEWYGYAVAKLEGIWRQAKSLFEEIRDADRGDQITDWNLACCEIKLGDRESAFQILRKRVESGSYIDEVLEATIALALEFKDKRFLSQHLDWLPMEEAILLGYLFAADSSVPSQELEQRLSAIEVIASDERGFKPPHPAEKMGDRDLNDLCFAFIQRRMVRGGITWFRRRVSFDEHKFFYLNWRILGDLCLQIKQFDEAARAYDRLLECTNNPRVRPDVKQQTLEKVLITVLEHSLTQVAQNLLSKHGSSMLPPAEFERWQKKIQPEPPPPPLPPASPPEKKETKETEKPQKWDDPQSKLSQVIFRLSKVRRIDDAKGDFTLLSDGTECLFQVWPAYSHKLVEQLKTVVQCLRDFSLSTKLEAKELLGSELREKMVGLKAIWQEIPETRLKEQAEAFIALFARLTEDASFQTNAVRSIDIDWHLNDYLPDNTLPPVLPELPKTCILLRVSNRGTELVADVAMHLQSESGKVTVVESVQRVNGPLEPEASAVVRFPLGYDSLEGEETFLVHVTFASGGVTDLQTPAKRFTLRAESFSRRLGGIDRIRDAFFVGLGIPEDRRDVFHGREREQKRIADSLRGSVQPEVLFLNGPRRAGKTSILNSLKWALPELGLKEIITVGPLPEEIPQTTEAFLLGIATEIVKAVDKHLNVQGYLRVPVDFKPEPTVAFKKFCEEAQQRLAPRRILLMIDETQRLAQAIRNGRIDDNVLGLFSTLMSRNSGIMFVFTASVLFRNVKDLSPNPIWGRLTQYATGFLNADAVTRVLSAGVANYPVKFAPEALQRVWQMTEGHPWVVQAIGKRIIAEVLNPQQRLMVGPPDVDQAVDFIEKTEDQYSYYWWNEKKEEGGFVDDVDWEIARVIIEKQDREGLGIPKNLLFQEMTQRGPTVNNERINKLADMQTLVKERRKADDWIRIKGLFLERWLKDQIAMRRSAGQSAAQGNVALFVDHENVSISMRKFIEELPSAQQATWDIARDPVQLSRRLAQHAERYGALIRRMAVADWRHFTQDLPAYAQAMFDFSQPLGGKNTSDEKLKELIRDTLEQEPEIGTYIVATGDADFRDTVQTLLKRNKRVVLWGFRAVGLIKSNMSSVFREMETWQNLTIEYLDDILPREPAARP